MDSSFKEKCIIVSNLDEGTSAPYLTLPLKLTSVSVRLSDSKSSVIVTRNEGRMMPLVSSFANRM